MLKLTTLIDAIKGNKKRIFLAGIIAGGILLWNFVLAPLAIANGVNLPVVQMDTFVDVAFALVGLI